VPALTAGRLSLTATRPSPAPTRPAPAAGRPAPPARPVQERAGGQSRPRSRSRQGRPSGS
jgi:hypothetical protein